MPDSYFCWLTGLIGDGYIEENYKKLLWKLYTTDFVYELEYDRNRAADGVFLRKIFAREMGFDIVNLQVNKPCALLEMMIALARDAEDNIMHDPDLGDRTGHWFWVMLENLNLDIYDDYNYNEQSVNYILDVFLHHKYAPNGGNGGMFPIRKCCRDMRKTDLWLQLNAYFEENYPIPIW